MTQLCDATQTPVITLGTTIEDDFAQDQVLDACQEEIKTAIRNKDPENVRFYMEQAFSYMKSKSASLTHKASLFDASYTFSQDPDSEPTPTDHELALMRDGEAAYSGYDIAGQEIEIYQAHLEAYTAYLEADGQNARNAETPALFQYDPRNLLLAYQLGLAKEQQACFAHRSEEDPLDALRRVYYHYDKSCKVIQQERELFETSKKFILEPSRFPLVPEEEKTKNTTRVLFENTNRVRYIANGYSSLAAQMTAGIRWMLPLKPEAEAGQAGYWFLTPQAGLGADLTGHFTNYDGNQDSYARITPVLTTGVGLVFPSKLPVELSLLTDLGLYQEQSNTYNELDNYLEQTGSEKTLQALSNIYLNLRLFDRVSVFAGYSSDQGAIAGAGLGFPLQKKD